MDAETIDEGIKLVDEWQINEIRDRYRNFQFDKEIKASGGEPITLYKYISVIALRDFAFSGRLKVTFPRDANDPFEMSIIGEAVTKENKLGDYGFISMSKESNNPSMWGNYADKYSGARLEIKIPYFSLPLKKWALDADYDSVLASEFAEMAREYSKSEPAFNVYFNNIARGKIQCVAGCIYQEERPKSPEIIDTLIDYTMSEEEKEKSRRTLYIRPTTEWFKYFMYKHKSWEHEHEYRILIGEEEIDNNPCCCENPLFFTKCISEYVTSITLAPFCPLSTTEIKFFMKKGNWTNGRVIDVKRAEITEDSYLLKIAGETNTP